MDVFAAHGYQRVKPPLLEFEDSLLAGSGAAVAEQTFRLMDPDSQRMMGLRADTTPQVARIATTRLAGAPRPLRLSYAGQCLRVRGSQLAPGPAGGPGGDRADRPRQPRGRRRNRAGRRRGAGRARTDPRQLRPDHADAGAGAAGRGGHRPAGRAALAHALDRKDAAAVARHGGALAPILTDLLLAAGPPTARWPRWPRRRCPTPPRALADAAGRDGGGDPRRAPPTLRLTIDPVEFRGFRYETGVSRHRLRRRAGTRNSAAAAAISAATASRPPA